MVEENPDLLQELEEERNRLLAEEQRLLAEKERLEKEVKEGKKDRSFFGTGNDNSFAKQQQQDKDGTTESGRIRNDGTKGLGNTAGQVALVDGKQVSDFTKTLDAVFLKPLPRPIQLFVRRILVRLRTDLLDVLQFARRQLDAVLGIVLKGIADGKTKPKSTNNQCDVEERSGQGKVGSDTGSDCTVDDDDDELDKELEAWEE